MEGRNLNAHDQDDDGEESEYKDERDNFHLFND